MSRLASRNFPYRAAGSVLSAGVGALIAAPLGLFASSVSAALCAAACWLARPDRASSASDAGRRAALSFAFLALLTGGAMVVLDKGERGPGLALMALAFYACDVPFYGFVAYVVGAVLVAPIAREAHRVVQRSSHDAGHRLVTTACLVGTFALLPSLAGAAHDDALAALASVAIFASWLACLWVVASHTSSHRLVARIREGRLAGHRLRPATLEELRALRPLFASYGDDQPMETLVRAMEVRSGAYREAPIEEPVALVPAPDAHVSGTAPVVIAMLVPVAQALLLLVSWSGLGH